MSSEPSRRRSRPNGPTDGRRPVRRDVSVVPTTIVAVGLTFGAYLLVAVSCTTTASPDDESSCYDRVVYHASRLTDC